MTTLEVLRRARALLEKEENWFKKTTNGPGKYCALSSLGVASGFSAHALCSAADLIEKIAGVQTHQLPTWNDAPERTHAEVLELFDKAIREEEKSADQA